MLRALSEYKVAGVATTIPFCTYVLSHPHFVSGRYNINFVDEYFETSKLNSNEDEELVASFIAASINLLPRVDERRNGQVPSTRVRWKEARLEE